MALINVINSSRTPDAGQVALLEKLISTGWEAPVSTGFPPGTAPPVLSARAIIIGQTARYQTACLVPVGNTSWY